MRSLFRKKLTPFILTAVSAIAINPAISMAETKATEFDPTAKPAPLQEIPFEFPEYKEHTLSNGLKLFIIEDNEAPIVEFRMLIPGGEALDRIPGQAGFMTSLLTKGYGDLDARAFAERLDGKGISFGASSSTEYMSISGNSLTDYQDIMWDALKGVLTDARLPEEELEKLVPQALANIQSQKGSPGFMASKLTSKVVFGNNHPYAAVMDENDVKNLRISDIRNFYAQYVKPKGSSLLVVGDVKAEAVIKKMEAMLSAWNGDAASMDAIPAPAPEPVGVYFIPREGSVQSTVRYVAPATEYTDRDRETLHLASGIISGGFSGRLFKTLREKHSYTYSPTGTLTSYKLFNYLMAGSDVRNEVTDSAIVVIQNEIRDLAQKGPGDEELAIMKKYQIGNYNMAFEDPSFAGSIIQNAYFKGQKIDYAKDFTKRKEALSASEVKKTARKYLLPERSFLVVLGDPSVKPSLEKFGKIYEYNSDIQPMSGADAAMKPVSDSPGDIIEDYLDAIGGKDNVSKVKSLTAEGKGAMIMQGSNFDANVRIIKTADGRFFRELTMPMQEIRMVYDGKDLFSSNNGIPIPITGPDKDVVILDEAIFPVVNLPKSNTKLKTLGEQKGHILVEASFVNGKKQVLYFDKKTNLLTKITETNTTPQGTSEVEYFYHDYKKFDGVMLPTKQEVISPFFSNTIDYNYTLNSEVEDSRFDVNKR
jgi:predicted Zn-dependent peptidase